MNSLAVECLGCGTPRLARCDDHARLDPAECPRCGYLGWAPERELTEADRDELRRHPLEQRGLLRRVA
jgi:hypothetical protein